MKWLLRAIELALAIVDKIPVRRKRKRKRVHQAQDFTDEELAELVRKERKR